MRQDGLLEIRAHLIGPHPVEFIPDEALATPRF
jgi:hypothetical protein